MLLVQNQLRDVLSSFGPSSNPRTVRDTLLRYFPDFMTAYGDTAAVLGADFYDMVRNLPVSAGRVESVFAQPAKVKQSEGVVRWAVGPLFAKEPSWTGFESALMGSSQRLIMQPARGTVDLLAQADARAGKVAATGWSRQVHPGRAKSGKSCDFCVMLAGRGPVYRSQEAAGARFGGGAIAQHEQAASFHDDCNCTTVPVFYRVSDSARNFGRGPERYLVPID